MTTNREGIARDDWAGAYGSGATHGWQRGAAARSQFLGPVTARMLDLAGVDLGSRVLDVGAGTGEQTLMAAVRVGMDGFVLATDVSVPMLAVATDAAREMGLANVQTQAMDARSLDVEPESFDAAISRNALMLMPERDRALVGIRRALKPGRKLAAIVFSAPEKNPAITLSQAAARRHAGLPPVRVEDPGLFALGDPGVLQAVYEQAGFHGVVIHAMSVVRRFASVRAAVQFRRGSNPEITRVLADVSDAERDRAWAEISEILSQFDGGDEVVEPCEYLIGVGIA